MLTLKPLAIMARHRINPMYSVSQTEVTIRRILEQIEVLLEEYRSKKHRYYAECPLLDIATELRRLNANHDHGGVFGQLCNAAKAVPFEVLKPIILLLPKKMYDTRYCNRYHVLVAGVHAAMIDMLAVDEIVQEPVMMIPSYNYIWSDDRVEEVDSIYFQIATYVGVSASTSGLARRLYLNQLNAIRKGTTWGEMISSLVLILASRISMYDDHAKIHAFFDMIAAHPEARKEYTVLEALINLDHYYNGTNCEIFKVALYNYCTYFAITEEECTQEAFMLNAI